MKNDILDLFLAFFAFLPFCNLFAFLSFSTFRGCFIIFKVLLDATYDCSIDCIEPTLEIKEIESTTDKAEKLEDKFADLSIKTNVMKTDVSNDDNEYASMNDFHLAETDLIRCLMRTNILQRIR